MDGQSFDAVLIYDGECPYCSLAARALERLETVGAVSWYDDAVAPFLRAQFDAEPFAMVLADVTEGRVYAGRSAAAELARRAGMPTLVGRLVRNNYDAIAGVVGLASGRDRGPANYHREYDLTPAARDCFESLATAARKRSIASS
ncbi:DCC1-like thiol-disulfide oxidoreductase family protein [Halorientalis brevis]|uniref:DCC1-like thiol-disulfide oxidoreductase family protein n=1 Tax=Halorientalis brevis TaxID=1126241 RepID=A0ABD6CEQ4_9EURY|nr:DCC1-like thiol-disulfide oxidoreductase family protein [Halorientalis brevis]